jgi:medium-chain acyl-[acyl-carrier-protein] hydrolase
MPHQTKFNYTVETFQVDAKGQTHIFQLLNFLQDAAHKHATQLDFGQDALLQEGKLWVLSRMYCEIIRLPVLGEQIKVITWVKSIRGAVSEREFILKAEGEVLMKASSLWFCLGVESRKPSRIPAHFVERMVADNNYATGQGTLKIEPHPNGKHLSTINETARFSDIDMAGHVNNVIYAKWAFDGLPKETLGQRQLKTLSINYLDEAMVAASMDIQLVQVSDSVYLSIILDTQSSSPICLVESAWSLFH